MDHCVVEAKFHTGKNLMQYATMYPISLAFEFDELNKISLEDSNKRERIIHEGHSIRYYAYFAIIVLYIRSSNINSKYW